MAWLNNDGLYVKFGTEKGHSITDGGIYRMDGDINVVALDLNLVDLTETETVQADTLVIPTGSLIEAIEVKTVVAATTGTAIDVGLINHSRNSGAGNPTHLSANEDPDALLAAFVTATMNAVGENTYFKKGASFPSGITTQGTAVGEILTGPCLITASRTDSTAFGAGEVRILIYFRENAAASNEFALGLS